MDVANPIRSVIPGAQGEVLTVLAHTSVPLSGRRVAELTNGRVSQKGTNLVLRSLAAAGLVTVEEHPPAKLYTLNRAHLAAESIETLANLRGGLLDALRETLAEWKLPSRGGWLFGSAARSDGTVDSDLDVLIVRPDDVAEADPAWLDQTERLSVDASAWTGNSCELVEYNATDFAKLMAGNSRLAADLRADGIALTEHPLPARVKGRR